MDDELRAAVAAGRYEAAVRIVREVASQNASAVPLTFGEGDSAMDREDIVRVSAAENDAEAVFELGATAWAIDGFELLAIDMFERAANAGSPRAVEAALRRTVFGVEGVGNVIGSLGTQIARPLVVSQPSTLGVAGRGRVYAY